MARKMEVRGRLRIPFSKKFENHGEGETGDERRHEDDGGEREARNTLL
jgi:hypothetical protein